MKIVIPQDLFSAIKNKHLLLDTNVFIDTSVHFNDFFNFISKLKGQNITLVTIDLVKIEFLKGAPTIQKYKEKNELIEKIIDYTIPITSDINNNVFESIKKYELYGKALSETDLFLGACLMKYKKDLFLLTRDTTDFPLNIFELVSVVNMIYTKGIHSYGVYKAK